jgi:hypothetical protein
MYVELKIDLFGVLRGVLEYSELILILMLTAK